MIQPRIAWRVEETVPEPAILLTSKKPWEPDVSGKGRRS